MDLQDPSEYFPTHPSVNHSSNTNFFSTSSTILHPGPQILISAWEQFFAQPT
jgi:hypothetical protein